MSFPKPYFTDMMEFRDWLFTDGPLIKHRPRKGKTTDDCRTRFVARQKRKKANRHKKKFK